MNDGNGLSAVQFGSIHGSKNSENPGWWTIKRWSEFMWFAQPILFALKHTFASLIVFCDRRTPGR